MGTSAEDTESNADLRLDASGLTVELIAEHVRTHGYFVTHLDPQPLQRIIDLRWAAQTAGRLIGRQVRAYTSRPGARVADKVTVIVAPVEFRCPGEAALRDLVRRMVEDILTVQEGCATVRPVMVSGRPESLAGGGWASA